MPSRTPNIVRDKIFSRIDEYTNEPSLLLDISKRSDWQYWQEFLNRDDTKSFRYISKDKAAITCIKESRRWFGSDERRAVWYAHKRLDNKLKRRYLGVSENLSYSKLKAIAFELCQREFVNLTT